MTGSGCTCPTSRKLASWYGIVSKHRPYQEAAAPDRRCQTAEADAETATDATPRPSESGQSDEPTEAEPLSTGGIIPEADAAPTAEGNPEAAAPAKKSRKKAE